MCRFYRETREETQAWQGCVQESKNCSCSNKCDRLFVNDEQQERLEGFSPVADGVGSPFHQRKGRRASHTS